MRSFFITVVAILMLAAGCSDSDDTSSTVESSGNGSPATTAEASDVSAPSSGTSASTADPPATSESAAPVAFLFTVDGVTGGSNVPTRYTCDGANETPTVTIGGVPSNVAELALIVDDPDAPTDSPFVHWLVYGISAETASVIDGDASLTYGLTDARTDGWFGPCPPPGDGLHTYRWRLFGLSEAMDLDSGLDGRALEAAIAPTVVTDALLIASYARAD